MGLLLEDLTLCIVVQRFTCASCSFRTVVSVLSLVFFICLESVLRYENVNPAEPHFPGGCLLWVELL